MLRLLITLLLATVCLASNLTRFRDITTDGFQPIISTKDTGTVFTCPIYQSEYLPTSVHQLMPGDIRIVAALGDSLTSGNGIDSNTIADLNQEKRGLVFSIGAEEPLESMTTISSILKEYNPNLLGYSNGTGTFDTPESGLNVAIPGAKSRNMVEQVDILIDRLTSDPNINMATDWKLLTMYIGFNDMCEYCQDTEAYSATSFVGNIGTALEKLKEKVSHALVNVIQLSDISILRVLDEDYVSCKVMRPLTCPCIVTEHDAEMVSAVSRLYQELLVTDINSGKYDTDDFAVVLQRQFENLEYPLLPNGEVDPTFLSVDCTHLSREGHDVSAKALWNNMFTAVGSKETNYDLSADVTLVCPEEGTYIYTNINSELNIISSEVDQAESIHTKITQHVALYRNSYIAFGMIVVFVLMLAIVSVVIIYATLHDSSNERKLQMYGYDIDDFLVDED